MQFYDNLNTILKQKNIKKMQLAEDIGVTKSNLHSWKNGCKPSIDYVIMLSEYLEVSADELLGLPNRQKEAEAPPDGEPDNIREAVDLLQQLPEREQVKFIGKLEDAVNNLILSV